MLISGLFTFLCWYYFPSSWFYFPIGMSGSITYCTTTTNTYKNKLYRRIRIFFIQDLFPKFIFLSLFTISIKTLFYRRYNVTKPSTNLFYFTLPFYFNFFFFFNKNISKKIATAALKNTNYKYFFFGKKNLSWSFLKKNFVVKAYSYFYFSHVLFFFLLFKQS
jgi:hypothetical protein